MSVPRFLIAATLGLLTVTPLASRAGENLPLTAPEAELPPCLNSSELANLVAAVDRGLDALQTQQRPDGSFATNSLGQPGVTSLAIMAYLSRGHVPGQGPYGETLDKALDYVLLQQKPSGIFCHTEVNMNAINRRSSMGSSFSAMVTQSYNHAVTMLMLGEVYGLTNEKNAIRIRNGIEKGLLFTIQLWDIRPKMNVDDGGFRYTQPALNQYDSDVSITAWHAASLRSLRNAGFDIPGHVMERIAAYIVRIQNRDGSLPYLPRRRGSHGMTAAGLLCLSLANNHNQEAIDKAARWLSTFNTRSYRNFSAGPSGGSNAPFYTCYYVSQASIQMGGQLWVSCFRNCADFLLEMQLPDGHWPRHGYGSTYGPSYSTSMAIISLTPILQILPIYQR